MGPPLRTVLLVAAVGALLSASIGSAQTALPPNEAEMVGLPVADARLVDENGEELRVGTLRGKPLIVSPIFTRCRHICSRITASLKGAVAEVGVAGEEFNVLSVTFDANDTERDLAEYKKRMGLPGAWKLARGESEEVLPFLDSIDFRFISQKDGQFVHPNLVVFLTPDLTIAKYLYGVDYEASDVRRALNVALGRGWLLDRVAPYVFLIGVLGTLGALFVILVTHRRTRRAPTRAR